MCHRPRLNETLLLLCFLFFSLSSFASAIADISALAGFDYNASVNASCRVSCKRVRFDRARASNWTRARLCALSYFTRCSFINYESLPFAAPLSLSLSLSLSFSRVHISLFSHSFSLFPASRAPLVIADSFVYQPFALDVPCKRTSYLNYKIFCNCW